MTRSTLTHTLGGPLLFLALALTPLAAVPYPVRAGFGLLCWMSWWWIAQPVHLAVTAFLPLVAPAIFGFADVGRILPSYAEPLVFLLLGANMLSTLWQRWGLDRRIALAALAGIGTGTRQQIVTWFIVSAALSAVLPNAVVAASTMPIIVAMLRFIGITDLARSAFGSALLIAVAWGTSIGGSGTPLGGAQNLLTIQFLQQRLIDHEFLFTTWAVRLLPLTLLVIGVAVVFMRLAFRPEVDHVEGSRTYFAQALRDLGTMAVPERWGLALFVAAMALSFSRQLYASAVPGLTPTFAFLSLGVLSFAIRHKGEPLLEWEYAQAHMVWGLIFLFAGGSALGQILSETGTAQFLADRLTPIAGGGGLLAVIVFTFLTMLLTQITSNTAAAAIVVPITISTFQGLGLNPVPFVYLVAAGANYGLMLPSSSAGPAVAAGYGVNLRAMLVTGLWLTLVVFVVLVSAGYALATYWPSFGAA